jgi:hypothetical protein
MYFDLLHFRKRTLARHSTLNRTKESSQRKLVTPAQAGVHQKVRRFRWTPFWLAIAPALPPFTPSMVITTG